MISSKFLSGRGRERLSPEDQLFLEESIDKVQAVPASETLIRRGEPVHSSMLIVEGFVGRSTDDQRGQRQMVSLHVPGDFVDLDVFKTKRLDHDIFTIGPAKVAIYKHDVIAKISERSPHLTTSFWISSLLDAAIHRAWIFRLGRLEADARIAHFFCELYTRLEAVGLVRNASFEFPLTQPALGQALGLTGVHTNRALRSLRERGFLTLKNRRVYIGDWRNFARLGNFSSSYLYTSGSKASDH